MTTVRRYTAADVPAMAAIYATEVSNGTATFELEAPSPAEMERRLAGIASRYPVLVATDGDGYLLGYAYANRYRDRAAFDWTAEDSIYVDATARGRGVGRTLLAALLDASAAVEIRQMVAIIGGSDNEASRRLHRQAGFALVGVQPAVGWKLGRWVDTIVMQRALGPGATRPP